jgi:hypothetical protein
MVYCASSSIVICELADTLRDVPLLGQSLLAKLNQAILLLTQYSSPVYFSSNTHQQVLEKFSHNAMNITTQSETAEVKILQKIMEMSCQTPDERSR